MSIHVRATCEISCGKCIWTPRAHSFEEVDGISFLKLSGADKSFCRLVAAYLGARLPAKPSLAHSRFFRELATLRAQAFRDAQTEANSGGLFGPAEGDVEAAGKKVLSRFRRTQQRDMRQNKQVLTLTPKPPAPSFRTLSAVHQSDALFVAVPDFPQFMSALKVQGLESEDWNRRPRQRFDPGAAASERVVRMGAGRMAKRGPDGKLKYVKGKRGQVGHAVVAADDKDEEQGEEEPPQRALSAAEDEDADQDDTSGSD